MLKGAEVNLISEDYSGDCVIFALAIKRQNNVQSIQLERCPCYVSSRPIGLKYSTYSEFKYGSICYMKSAIRCVFVLCIVINGRFGEAAESGGTAPLTAARW